jgi:hypothetical protein
MRAPAAGARRWKGARRLRAAGRDATGVPRASATAAGRRATTLVLTTAALLAGGSSNVFACPVCFGAEETPLIDATKLGIAALLAITLAVQGAFVGFFLYLRNRAKRIADLELDTEWSELQKSSRTS